MATPVKMQRLSKYAETSEVLEWFKSPGEAIREGELLLTVSSDKATVEIGAPAGGVLLKIVVPAGREAPAGTVLAWIGQPGEKLEQAVPDTTRARVKGRHKISPVARRLAKEQGLDIEQIEGTGPGGIITKADVLRYSTERHTIEADRERPASRRGPTPGMSEKAPPATQPVIPAEAPLDEPERATLPLGGLRRVMAQRMTASHQTIVQATTVADVDMTEIVRLRERVPASFTAFVVKAAARAVAGFPLINASLEKDALILHRHVHMGVAVTTDDGLLVPVIQYAESKSLAQIHGEIKTFSERARNRALTVEEMSGPTMTVTNSGAFGSLLFTPIIVAPQSATLGMGKVAPTPVVREGQIAVREIMYLCLSYDHRFLDGAIAVRYLQQVRAYLEDPISLLWDEEE